MVRLGLRLTLRGGREAATRLVITAMAVAIGVGVLLTTLAALHAVRAQNDRYGWLETASSAEASHASTEATASDPLWWLLRGDHFRGRLIGRVDVAATGPSSPVPPGIPRLPAPGEFYASPALTRLLASAPRGELADRFGGHEVGIIAAPALPAPDSLLMIRGLTPGELSRVPDAEQVTSISTSASPGDCSGGCASFGFDANGMILILSVVAGAILFPVLVFIGTATRLSATRREQRFAAMRLVGATPRQISVVAAVESSVAAVAGVAGGLAVFLLLRPLLARVPFTGARFFPSDLSLTPEDVLFVLLGIPVASAVVARLALHRVNISPLGATRRVTPKPPRLYRFIPLAAGIAVLTYFVVFGTPDTGSGQAVAYLSGMLLVMAGLVVAGPWLTMAAARAMARRATEPSSLIAARRLADNPQAGFRAISGLVLALFVTTAAIGTITTFVAYRGAPTNDSEATGTLVKDFTTFTASGQPEVIPSVPAHTLAALRAIHGISGLAVIHPDPDPPLDQPSRSLVSCADVARTPALGACAAGQETATTNVGWGYKSWRDASRTVRPSVPMAASELAALPVQSLVLTGSPEGIERARTVLELAFPRLDTPETLADISAYQLQLSTQYQQLADVVILVSLFLAGCSLAVSVAAGLSERKRPFSLLRLTGVPLSMLRRLVVLESAVPLLAAAGVSIAAGFLAAELFVRAQLGYSLQAPGRAYYVIVAVGIIASLGVIASTLPIIDRITGPETARNE